MNAVRWRPLVASVGLGILLTGGLTACQTKVGAAAVVGGHRITESEVSSYVSPSGPSRQAQQQAAAQGATIPAARAEALSELVREQVFRDALASTGGVPNDSELAGYHDEAARRLLQTTLVGPALDQAVLKQFGAYGLTDKFATLFVRNLELADAFANASKAANANDLFTKLRPFAKHVEVSPRYGRWLPRTLTVSGTSTEGTPPFVQFGSPATG
jgi:hypothetical protein